MNALDLSAAPPRNPYAQLEGIIFLPRTIDKICASLPGGNLGDYSITGFSTMMLDALGITLEAFTAVVRDAADDETITKYVKTQTTPERIAAWDATARAFVIRGGDRAAALAGYPWLAAYEELPKALDALVEDDRRLFPTT